ncbi:MAG: methionyl-tRNA formyltransferase [Terrimicrobiaceae bacterium]
MKILFLGTGEIGVPTLRALAGHHEICGIYTQPDRPAGRKLQLKPSPVKVAARELGISVYQPEKLRGDDTIQQLRDFQADLFFVAAYGQILSSTILDIPRLGCVNLHTSLLPRHRGASPIHAAILAGDAESGVTLMFMDKGLDTGDIILQHRISILSDDTAGTLHDRLAVSAPVPTLEALGQIEQGTVTRTPQDSDLATYAAKITKAEGCLDWAQSAVVLSRKVKAFQPWPGTFTFLPDGSPLKIHSAQVVEGSGQWGTLIASPEFPLVVATARGALALQVIQIPGGKALDAATFLLGHSLPPGTQLRRASLPL